MKVLVINPGSTSTKIAVFDDENEVISRRIDHPSEELDKFDRLIDQKEFRKQAIIDTLKEAGFEIKNFDAIACRGGILPPLSGGTYKVEQNMVDYLANESPVEHASNLAAVIGYELAKPFGIPVYITDPISVDEMIPEAKLSGIPEIERKSYGHYLNMKAVSREVANKEFGKKYEELNFVVVHLGGGISVAAHRKGKVIDINNANDEGPFSPERAGELPVGDLVKVAYSGKYSKRELKKRYVGKGGLVAYLGTNDMREALKRAKEGDEKADLIVRAMAYQIAKEIGGMMAVLKGKVDGIILTGGMAYNKDFTDMIRGYVERYAPVYIIAGEFEMIALAKGALRVLKGEEEAKQWKKEG